MTYYFKFVVNEPTETDNIKFCILHDILAAVLLFILYLHNVDELNSYIRAIVRGINCLSKMKVSERKNLNPVQCVTNFAYKQ